MLKRFLKDKSGATAVVFAIAAPAFIGGITLAVELGHWHQKKSKLQDLADNSAVAAAQEIMLIGNGAKIDMAGKGHAFENGFNFSSGQVSVNSPPTEGKYSGRNDMVEVVMNRKQDLYFSQIFGGKTINMESRAIAAVLEGVQACILALSPTQSGAIAVDGNASVDVQNCGVHANSNSDYAVQIGNSNTITAECLSTTGGIDAGGTVNITCESGMQEYSRTVRDPYADLRITESVSSMGCTTARKNKKNRFLSIPAGSDAVRICASVYSGGLLEFESPGTYYFDGADMGTSSSHALVYGRGVTIIFMNGGTFNGASGGGIDITAASTGKYAGLVMYFDPDSTTDEYLKINGNATSNIEGVIYAPTINVQMNGTANHSSKCTHVIANTVDFRGNAGFNNTGCEEIGARQIGGETGVALVE